MFFICLKLVFAWCLSTIFVKNLTFQDDNDNNDIAKASRIEFYSDIIHLFYLETDFNLLSINFLFYISIFILINNFTR